MSLLIELPSLGTFDQNSGAGYIKTHSKYYARNNIRVASNSLDTCWHFSASNALQNQPKETVVLFYKKHGKLCSRKGLDEWNPAELRLSQTRTVSQAAWDPAAILTTLSFMALNCFHQLGKLYKTYNQVSFWGIVFWIPFNRVWQNHILSPHVPTQRAGLRWCWPERQVLGSVLEALESERKEYRQLECSEGEQNFNFVPHQVLHPLLSTQFGIGQR